MTNQSWQQQYLNATATQQINQQPYSKQFDDVYFNDQGGLAETNHVFIKQNHLLRRWQQNTNQASFCITETGFGTGLNLLTTWQAWRDCNDKPEKLHFISCEKYPLSHQDMLQAHRCFPELETFSQQLLNIWHAFDDVFRSGFHTFQMSHDVTLTLAFGDATESLSQLNAKVDAWYLDGFAPSKNPDMWHNDLFVEINRLSHVGTTLSTFTAASQVRKALQDNGFEVVKKPGFGKKREMITAEFRQPNVINSTKHLWCPQSKADTTNKSVTILGGGIAGMCLAYFFKQSGHHVTVVDQHKQPMQAASGNDLAMVMPVLTAQPSPESAFYLRAFEAALRFYQTEEWHATGVRKDLVLAKDKQWADAIQKSKLPNNLITIESDSNVLYTRAGYVDTQLLAARLRLNVDQWIRCDVDQIDSTATGQWRLLDNNQKLVNESELLILTNGIKAQQLMASHDLCLTAKHGMTTTIKPPNDQILKHIQLAQGYVIPNQDQQHWLCGATFDHLDPAQWYQGAQLHHDHWQRNLQLWQGLPLQKVLEKAQVIKAHAAIRATTADHLPICGPLIDQTQFKADYQDLHHGRHWQQYPPAKALGNLYVLNGLGSRGFTSAPFLAQYLYAMIVAEPLPLEADLCKIIHPNRFLYRSLKKTPKN